MSSNDETKITLWRTADFLADAFCRMGADQQARFFAVVAERAQEWPETEDGDESQWETVGFLVSRGEAKDSVYDLVAEWCRCFGRRKP